MVLVACMVWKQNLIIKPSGMRVIAPAKLAADLGDLHSTLQMYVSKNALICSTLVKRLGHGDVASR